jgi:hypothetical protein
MGQSPIPQYYSEANDAHEPIKGEDGAQNVRILDGHDQTQGSKADAAASDSTSSWSLVSLLKGVWAKLEVIRALLNGTLAVNGTVNVGNLPSTQTVDGSVSVSNLPATQTVSGTVATNTTLVAPIPAGTNVIGKTGIDSAANGVKNVDGAGNELFTVANPAQVALQASAASGSAVPSKIVQVGGVNSGNLYALTLDSANRLIATLPTVEGAAGQTAPTKFLMLGATDGANAQALKVDAQKNLLVGLRNSGGGEMVANATGNGHNGSAALRVASSLYNGTTFDFQHANTEGTLLASAARTATTTSANQTNHNARGVLVTLNVTVAGTGGLTVRVWALDPISGSQIALDGNAPAAITATGRYAFMLYPGIVEATKTGSGFIQQTRSIAVPRTWFAQVAHADGSSWTYSLSYQYIV